MEAIVAATRLGGQIMMQGDELGQIREGASPTCCWSTAIRSPTSPSCSTRSSCSAIMKDGTFHKEPELRATPQRWNLSRRMNITGTVLTRDSGWLAIGVPLVGVRRLGAGDQRPAVRLTLLNGLTLAALYFLVASGFTLVFGLMRNVNLAHGSLFLLGAYVGWVVGDAPESWVLARGRRLPRRPRSSGC